MTFGAHRYIHPTRLIRVRVGRPWAGIQGHWCRFVGFAASRFIPITLGAFSIVHFVAYPLYFVLGYLLIAAMYATGGAAMKDVHSGGAQGMVGIVPYLPMMFVAAIVEHPEQTWIRIASFFPPFTPSLMLIRLAITKVPW